MPSVRACMRVCVRMNVCAFESYINFFYGFCVLLTTEIVPKIFQDLNVVAHLVVPVGWGSCLPRLAIF